MLQSDWKNLVLCIMLLVASACTSATQDVAQRSEEEMLPKGLQRSELRNESVKRALARVPRHYFVPEEYRTEALEDKALEIGFGQTISQPFIVALMTEHAGVQNGSRVLEVGTGSGYQAAVLSELGAEVYSIEIIPELSEQARRTLYSLGYEEVRLRIGDGIAGWPEQAPFDAIIVTAASPVIPMALVNQLSPTGKMVIPVEAKDKDYEELMLVSREGETVITKRLGAVRFVPLTGAVRNKSTHNPHYQEPHLLREALRGGPEKSSKE